MKVSLRKSRGFALQKHQHRYERESKIPSAQLVELSQATQDMDMRDCYYTLLSVVVAATANIAYESSESLRKMGDYLLQNTSLNDDEKDYIQVLVMLRKSSVCYILLLDV